MLIKLIAIDLDGTLLNDHHQITAVVKEAINDAVNKGVYYFSNGQAFFGD